MSAITSNVFSMIVKGALAVVDASLAIDELQKLNNPEEGKILQSASLINKLVLLGFSVGEIGALAGGVKSDTLMKLKTFELLPRTAEMPLELIKGGIKLSQELSVENCIRLAEKGVIAPLSGIIGTIAQASAYYESHFIEMTPEEREQAKRPIYEYDPATESYFIAGYRPVTLEECKTNLEVLQKISSISGCVKIGAELELIGNSYKGAKTVYEKLSIFFQQHGRYLPRIRRSRERVSNEQNANAARKVEELEEVISLRALPMIPSSLHEDVILKQFICPITNLPIRHPVADPNGHTVYERSAILAWLSFNPTSPVTRESLTPDKLLERPALETLINERLKMHEKKLWDYVASSPELQQQLLTPAPLELVEAAEVEENQSKK